MAAEPLRLVDIFKTAISHLWVERISLAKMLILVGLVNGVLVWFAANAAADQAFGKYFIIVAIKGVVYTILAVRAHRLVLEVADQGLDWFRWTSRETRFLGWLIVVYVYLTLVFLTIAAILGGLMGGDWVFSGGTAVGVLVTLPGAYLFVRLLVLLPATAINQKRSMAWAWVLTEKNGWRLVLLLWLFPMLASMLVPYWETDNPVALMFWEAGVGLFAVLEIALLSVAFRALGGLTFDQPHQKQVEHP